MKKAFSRMKDSVVNIYQKIENAAVNGYRKIENGAVGGFRRVSDFFIGKLFSRKGETVEDTRKHLGRK